MRDSDEESYVGIRSAACLGKLADTERMRNKIPTHMERIGNALDIVA